MPSPPTRFGVGDVVSTEITADTVQDQINGSLAKKASLEKELLAALYAKNVSPKSCIAQVTPLVEKMRAVISELDQLSKSLPYYGVKNEELDKFTTEYWK
ncbi:hypothetical protein FQN51_007494 [Onygenales sp. PD_10]|nr:hypothetical protein FQN51_007494 [Onygenales sp. PD_10]